MPFEGTIVTVPIIENATQVEVGVYVDDISTTTPAVIPCSKSIRCGSESEYIPPHESRNLESRVTDNTTAITNINQNFAFATTNNLFNPDAVLRGDIRQGVFTASDTSRYFCTDFIKVKPYDIMTASASLDGVREYAGMLYQYTSDKTYITGKGFGINSKTTTLTENTEYIRYTVRDDYTDVCLKHNVDLNIIYEPYYDGYRWVPKGLPANHSETKIEGYYDVVITNSGEFTTKALADLNLPDGARIWAKLKNCSFDVTLPWAVRELRLDIYENTLPDWECNVQAETLMSEISRCKLTGHHMITLAKNFSEVEGVPNTNGTAKRYENCTNIHNLDSWNGTTEEFVDCKRLMNISSHGYSMKFINCSYMTNVQANINTKYEGCTFVDPYTCYGYSAE